MCTSLTPLMHKVVANKLEDQVKLSFLNLFYLSPSFLILILVYTVSSAKNNESSSKVSSNPYDLKPGESESSNCATFTKSIYTTTTRSITTTTAPLAKNPYDVKPGENQVPLAKQSGSGISGSSGIPPPPPLPTAHASSRKRSQIHLRTKNWGQRTPNGWSNFNRGIYENDQLSFGKKRPPAPPPLPDSSRKYRAGPYAPIRLRTRDWGERTPNGWSKFNNKAALEERFAKARIPPAPPLPQQRQKTSFYKPIHLRTRDWGVQTEQGWSKFNRGIFQDASLYIPFSLSFYAHINYFPKANDRGP